MQKHSQMVIVMQRRLLKGFWTLKEIERLRQKLKVTKMQKHSHLEKVKHLVILTQRR